jgi:hypothetical protein
LLAILIFNVAPTIAATGAKGLRPKTRKITRSGRFIAKAPLQSRLSVGLNYLSYIFEIDNPRKEDPSPVIKLSYRFALRDPEIPQSFFDYFLLHTFRMSRDESCDEPWSAISKSHMFGKNGNYGGVEDTIVYSSNAPATQFGEQMMLACYVVTPDDYKFTKSRPGNLHREVLQARNDEVK